MAFEIRHETDPRLLGTGAYASGLAEYDRRREQLALAYNQLAQQRAMSAANRRANTASQPQAQQHARNQQLMRSQMQQAANAQHQQDVMARMDHEADLQQQAQQFQADQRIRLNQNAYELKRSERDRQIAYVQQAPWDDQTKRNAISKINLGFAQYEVEQPPSFEERIGQQMVDKGKFIVYGDDNGRLHIYDKPPENVGQQIQIDAGGGRMVPGFINAKGEPTPFDKNAFQSEGKVDQGALYKQLIEARERARKNIMETNPPFVMANGESTGQIDTARLETMINESVQAEQQFLQQRGWQGQGGTITPQALGDGPAAQQQLPGGPAPVAQDGITPEQLVPQMFVTVTGHYGGVGPGMNPEQLQQAIQLIKQDLTLIATAYRGDKSAIYQNEQHREIYERLKRDLMYLKETYGG